MKNDGGPAFPAGVAACPDGVVIDSEDRGFPGMTLRDYFAAKAMAGFLASPTTPEKATAKQIAGVAYGMADAMLAMREAK